MSPRKIVREGLAGWEVRGIPCPRCHGNRRKCDLCAGNRVAWFLPETLVREMQYTTWEQSCKDPAAFGSDLRECRRPAKHAGPHASGFVTSYKEWGHTRAT